VAWRAQWAQVLVCVGVTHALGYEVAPADGPVVSDSGERTVETADAVAA
jgi:hypothetical protein